MVQWLGLGTFAAVAWVQSLVGELRSCKPQDEMERFPDGGTETQRGKLTCSMSHNT